MRLVQINQDNIDFFSSLLLPWSEEQILSGMPMTSFGLIEDELAVGALAGYVRDGYFLITSLYVAEEYRRRGGARLMLDVLSERVSKYVSGILIQFIVSEKEHITLTYFLESYGFSPDTGITYEAYRSTVEDALESSFYLGVSSGVGVSLRDIDQLTRVQIAMQLEEENVPIEGDAFMDGRLDEDATIVVMDGETIKGFVAFEYKENLEEYGEAEGKGVLLLSAAWNNTGNAQTLIAMLQSAASEIEEKYPPETVIYIYTINEVSTRLVLALLNNATTVSVSYVYSF